jgi:ATP-binding cassette, subfamily B (MDR/TAP), member 1
MIERFYDPLDPTIHQLDGHPISELNIQIYRKQIALVSQEPVRTKISRHICDFPTLLQTLYAGTVRFNVLLGAIKPESEVTQEEVELACCNANILDFINLLSESVLLLCFSIDRFTLL